MYNFYQLLRLRNYQRRVSLLSFLITSNLDIGKARQFIDDKAIALSATPEIDENGKVYYIFQ